MYELVQYCNRRQGTWYVRTVPWYDVVSHYGRYFLCAAAAAPCLKQKIFLLSDTGSDNRTSPWPDYVAGVDV